MRTVLILSMCLTTIGFSVLPALPAQAAPKAPKQELEENIPIHAVLMIRGWGLATEGCSRHGCHIVWEGDLDATDDDPEGIFPCASYGAGGPFFTTLKFDDYVCRQEGVYESRTTHRYGSNPTGVARLILVQDMGDGSLSRSIRFVFHGFELGRVINSDVGGDGPILLDLSWRADFLSPPLRFTEKDFEQGFERTYRTTRGIMDDSEEGTPEIQMFAAGDEYEAEATLTLSYKQDTKKPKVEIAGCAHLLPGGSEQLTATGTPSGGRYRWTGEPSSVLGVSGTESSAEAKAGDFGHASVRVEYEAPNGKKAEATLSGSVVTLTSVNGGAAIPTLYLYDAYGNPRPPTEVPTVQDPPDGDLLTFAVTDRGIATVMNMGSSLLLQGVNEGSTTAQAQTKCGEKTGPVITLTVARCDPEMIAELHKRYDEIRKKRDESAHRANEAISSHEFNEASDEIAEDIIDVAIEAVETVSGGAGKLATATKAVIVAHKAISAGTTVWSTFRDGSDAALVKGAVIALGGPAGIAAVSTYDKLNTVGKFLKHTGVLLDAAETIEREQPIQDGYSKELDQINKLIEKCKEGSKGGPPPKKEPTTPKPKVEPPTGKKGGDKPAPGEPPTPTKPGEPSNPTEPGEPGGGKTGGGEPPPPPEPPAKPGGGTAGLPIDCGCKDASAATWKSEKNGLAAIAASLGLLQACAENYENELKSFQADSAGMTQTRSAIETALDTPGEKGFKQFSASAPGLEAAAKSWEGLSKAATEFSNTLVGCDKKMPEAAGLIKKAGQALGTTTPEGGKR